MIPPSAGPAIDADLPGDAAERERARQQLVRDELRRERARRRVADHVRDAGDAAIARNGQSFVAPASVTKSRQDGDRDVQVTRRP